MNTCQVGCDTCSCAGTSSTQIESNNLNEKNVPTQKLNLKLKESLRDQPYNILFKPTHNCNIKCVYCYDRVAQIKHGKGVMPIEKAKRVIDMVKADPRQCMNFTFHGGEPLMPGIEWYKELLPYIKEKLPDMPLSMQTNGTLLTKEFLDLFKEYKLVVGLSYDLYPEDLPKNMWYRPNIPLKKFKKLLEYDKKTEPRLINGFISVVSSINYKNLANSVRKAKEEIGLSAALNFLFPTNEIGLNGSVFYSYEEYAEEMKKLLIFYLTEYDVPEIERGITHLTSYLHGGTYSCCNRKNCSYGWVGIGPNGELAHCDTYSYGKYFLGNIDDYEHITDMQYTENYNNIACDKKAKRLTNCQRCPLSDICRGTCFANSLNDEGDGMIFDSNACNELHYGLFGMYQVYRNYNVFSYAKETNVCAVQKQLILNDFYTMWEINDVIKKELGVDLYTLEEHSCDTPHRLFQSKEFQIFRIFNPSQAVDDVLSPKQMTNRIVLYNTEQNYGEYLPKSQKITEFLSGATNYKKIVDERRMAIKYGLIENLSRIKEILNK